MLARRSGLSVVALAAVFVPLAISQPQPTRSAISWLLSGQVFLSDEGLQKELKLTPEQSKKATELAKSAQDRVRSRLRAEANNLEKMDQEIKKDLEGILKPEQMTRLRQVILQNMANSAFLGASAILGDEEVVKRLKFTDEQSKKLRAREKLDDVLTEAQKAEWKKIIGAPYTARLQSALASSRPTPSRASIPQTLYYLSAQSIRDDLKLTDKQQAKVLALSKKHEEELTRERDSKKSTELLKKGEEDARALLEPAQSTRLDQIVLQIAARTNTREDSLLKQVRVSVSLRLTEGQQKTIDSILEQRRKAMLALFTADEEPQKILEKVQAFKNETTKQLQTILDPRQQAALKDLVGKPFTGDVAPYRFVSSSGPLGKEDGFSGFSTTSYLYITGAAYLGSPDLHKELKINAEKAKKLTELAEKAYSGSRGFGTKAKKTQADTNRKELATILDANQIKRFEEVYWQTRTTTVHRYEEVRQALKLTDAQLTKLNSRNAQLTDVLDENQSKIWKQMQGAPFTGRLTLPTRVNREKGVKGKGGPADKDGKGRPSDKAKGKGPANKGSKSTSPFSSTIEPSVVSAIKTAAVRDELKLTESQKTKLSDAETEYKNKTTTPARGPNRPSFEDFMKQRAAAGPELAQAITKILDEKQNARLQQILLQDAQRSGLKALFTESAVIASLKLDDEQQKKLNAIARGGEGLIRQLQNEYSEESRTFAQLIDKAQEMITKNTEKRMEAVLTDKQKTQLRTLLGEPFKGKISRPVRKGLGSSSGFGGRE